MVEEGSDLSQSMPWRTGFLGGLGLTALLVSPAFAGPEQRCNELGTACDCSEPLNANQSIPAQTFVDFDDSPNSSECDGETTQFVGSSLYLTNGGQTVDPDSEGIPFPAGSRVGHVVSKRPNGVSHLWGNRRSFDDGTLCVRSYHRWSEDYEVPFSSAGNDKRIKVISFGDFTPGQALTLQNEVHHGDPNDPYFKLKFVSTWWGVDTNLGWRGPTVTFGDCKDSWCRFELCLDHDASGHITGRGRIVQLSNGDVQTYGPVRAPVRHDSVNVNRPWIAELFDQNIHAPGEHRYVSYGMQAFVSPADSDFWIGAAQEVEGSGGNTGGSSAPPSPPPPADPISQPSDDETPSAGEDDPVAAPQELLPPGQPVLIQDD